MLPAGPEELQSTAPAERSNEISLSQQDLVFGRGVLFMALLPPARALPATSPFVVSEHIAQGSSPLGPRRETADYLRSLSFLVTAT